jgi:hypothetical protein
MRSDRFARSVCVLILMAAICALGRLSAQSAHVTTRQAKDHIGETQTVCGKAVSTRYAAGSKGRPTFLNLDEPYPNEVFTILIWGDDRSKFGAPETEFRDKNVCVTGKITSYRGTPEIVATEPSQIVAQK